MPLSIRSIGGYLERLTEKVIKRVLGVRSSMFADHTNGADAVIRFESMEEDLKKAFNRARDRLESGNTERKPHRRENRSRLSLILFSICSARRGGGVFLRFENIRLSILTTGSS